MSSSSMTMSSSPSSSTTSGSGGMASLQALLEEDNATADMDAASLARKMQAVQDVLNDTPMTGAERDAATALLVDRLVPLGRAVADKKAHTDSAAIIAKILTDNVMGFTDGAAEGLRDLSRSFVIRSASSKVQAAGIELMTNCFERWPGEDGAKMMDPLKCEKLLVDLIVRGSKYTPTVVGGANRCLGSLCRAFPDDVRPHADTVFGYLDKQLTEQVRTTTRQPAMSVVEGCLRGISDYVHAFGLPDGDEAREKLYDLLKRICPMPKRDELSRRTAMRCAVDLFADHAPLFAAYAVGDCNFWHSLLREWAFSSNRDDHKTGWRAILSFYRAVGVQLSKEKNERAFNGLLEAFKKTLAEEGSSSKETSLAIQGYGHLAAACKKWKSSADLSAMLSTLLNRTEQVFFSSAVDSGSDFEDDRHLHLSSYLEALTCVVRQSYGVSPSNALSFERIVSHAVATFPRLPVQYHTFALVAVRDALGEKPQALMSNLVSTVVYQGVIQSCSYPVVTKTEEELLQTAVDRIVSVDSFFPLWCGLLRVSGDKSKLQSDIFGALMESFVTILEKLDFSMRETSDDEQQVEGEQASKGKDFTVMANLVKLYQRVSQSSPAELFESWAEPFAAKVSAMASRCPQVSGFYRLFASTLSRVKNTDFAFSTSALINFSAFVRDSLGRCGSFDDGELLLSCLQMCLDVPVAALAGAEGGSRLLSAYAAPLERVFRCGARNLPLANAAVDFLCAVQEELDKEEVNSLVLRLMPSLKAFLYVSQADARFGDDDDGEGDNRAKLARRRRKNKKKPTDRPTFEESDYERTQKRLLLFLGRLDTDVLMSLEPSKEETGRRLTAAFGADRALKFEFPFPDVNVEVPLDDLLPRILHLCLESTGRKTRVAACEALHSIVLLIIGRSAGQSARLQNQRPLTPLFSRIFPAMIALSGDSDVVVRDLFRPLLVQCIHWFTRLGSDPPEAACLLSAILDGLCGSSAGGRGGDVGARKTSAELLAEFLRWTIKQTPEARMEAAAAKKDSPVSMVFGRICSMWMHPSGARRLGAGLAFNQVYRDFREEEPLVDRFALQLAVHALRSLSYEDRSDPDSVPAAEEAKKSLVHLLRIVKQKSALLEEDSDARLVPTDVGGSKLWDFVVWLFGLTWHESTELRHKAIELLHELTDGWSGKDWTAREAAHVHLKRTKTSKDAFLRDLAESDDLIVTDNQLGTSSDEEVLTWLSRTTARLECLTYVTAGAKFAKVGDDVLGQNSRMIKSLGVFVGAVEKLQARSAGIRALCPVLVVRTLDLMLANMEFGSSVVARLWKEEFSRLLVVVAHCPSRLGFGTGSEVTEQLGATVKRLLSDCQAKHINAVVPTPTYQGSDVMSLSDALAAVLAGKADEDVTSFFRGYAVFRDLVKAKQRGDEGLSAVALKLYEAKLPEGAMGRQKAAVAEAVELSLAATKKRPVMIKCMAAKYFEKPSCKTMEDIFLSHLLREPASVLLEEAKVKIKLNKDRVVNCLVKISQSLLLRGIRTEEGNGKPLLSLWESLTKPCPPEAVENAIAVAKSLCAAWPDCSAIAGVREWFCKLLARKDVQLVTKAKSLDLLSCLLRESLEKGQREEIEKALEQMADRHFPLSSKEIRENTPQWRDLNRVFDVLLASLKETGAPEILSFLSVNTCREDGHFCDDKIQSCLADLLTRMPAEGQVKILDSVYYLYDKDVRCRYWMKYRILHQVLVPLLSGASVVSLQRFFAKNVQEVLEGLQGGLAGGEEKRIHVLVKRMGSCKMVACMYGKMPKDLIHAPGDITDRAFQYLKKVNQTKTDKPTGKEMGQFLVGKLVGFRAEVTDGSPELKEFFRQFQCAAYNAVMSVISCLQDAEKFYLNYIFKENYGKSELIWARILDTDKEYKFPLEVDTFARKRRQIVSIRKSAQAKAREAEAAGFSSVGTLASHYLGDSSLSQEVTMFDFNQSIVNMSQAISNSSQNGQRQQNGNGDSSAASKEPDGTNAVYLDSEDLNFHECMAPLLAVIDYMKDTKVYAVPEEEEEGGAGQQQEPESMPGWMNALVDKLQDETANKNVKLFILKVILNRPGVFGPYARILGIDLLRLSVLDDLWEEMNTLRMDVITLLLTWGEADKYIPSSKLIEKNFATSLLELLISSALEQTNREVLKYMVELIRTMSNVWGPKKCLNVPSRELAAKVHPGQPNSHVAVQIVGILLQASLLPVSESSVIKPERFFAPLAANLDEGGKQGYEQTAEVLGMALKVYKEKEPTIFQQLEDLVVEKIRKLSKNPGAREHDKFVSCLYHCHKNYGPVASHFQSKFIYELRREQGPSLTYCLEMLSSLAPTLAESENGLRKELSMIGLGDFLSHYDRENQLAALAVLERLVPLCGDASVLADHLRAASALVASSSQPIKLKVCDVMAEVFKKFGKPFKDQGQRQVYTESLLTLCRALGDSDAAVVTRVEAFLDEVLPEKVGERFADALGLLFNDAGQDSFLVTSTAVLMSLAERSPQFKRVMFQDPLSADCHFQEQVIDTSWRSQSQADLTPKFAETLTSSSQAWSQSQAVTGGGGGGGGSNFAGFIRATQAKREFELTQTQVVGGARVLTQASSSQGPSSSQGAFSQGLGGTQHMNGSQIISSQQSGKQQGQHQVLRVGRRFKRAEATSRESAKGHFARLHARRERRVQLKQEERRGRRLAQVDLMRRYRVGELPDIQITCGDVVRTVKNVCARDAAAARILVHQIGRKLFEEDAGGVGEKIGERLAEVMKETQFSDATAASSVLELCLAAGVGEVDMDRVVGTCRSLNLQPLGVMLAEDQVEAAKAGEVKPQAKKKKKASQGEDAEVEAWLRVVDLHKSTSDFDAARGAMVASGVDEAMVRILSKESESSWLEVVGMSEKMRKKKDLGEEDRLSRALMESHVNAMEQLSKWDELGDEVLACAKAKKPDKLLATDWRKEFLLPKYVRSGMHNIVEMPARASNSAFHSFMDAVRKEQGSARFGQELTMLYLMKGASKLPDAELALEMTTSQFLSDWSSSSSSEGDLGSTAGLSGLLHRLKSLSQLSWTVGALKDEKKREALLKEWRAGLSMSGVASLQHGDDLVRDRAVGLKAMAAAGLLDEASGSEIKVKAYHDLLRECVSRNQWDISAQVLQVARAEEGALKRVAALSAEHDLIYADTVALKAANTESIALDNRLNAVYRSLVNVESGAEAYSATPASVAATRAKQLRALEQIISGYDKDEVSVEKLGDILSNATKKEHFAGLAVGVDGIDSLRAKLLREVCESQLVHSSALDGRQWLELTEVCQRLLGEFGAPAEEVAPTMVDAHTKAISMGNVRARQLFPDLMTSAQDVMEDRALSQLEERLEEVEPWLLLPWTNQLLSSALSLKGSKAGEVWLKVLTRMARAYPDALRFPYLVSKSAAGDAAESLGGELEELLALSPLQERLVKGLAGVSLPEVKISDELTTSLSDAGGSVSLQDRIKALNDEITSQKDMYGPAYQDCARRFLTRRGAGSAKKVASDVRDELRKKKTWPTTLGEYVPFLADYHGGGGASVEIPGQYAGYQRPRPESHARLACFQDEVTVFRSLRKPIAVGMVGDDGKTRRFIVKCGEDLRQDERIEQVFAIANRSFQNLGPRMQIRTYSVVPLTTRTGLIECMEEVVPYSQLATPTKQAHFGELCSSRDDYKSVAARPAATRAKEFEKWASRNDCGQLRKSLSAMANCPSGFYFLRDNFVRSHALHSLVGWLVSLGDRHAENLLVSKVTGESIAIDFGYSFGATAFLPIPELVPFRLTPQIQGLMSPAGPSGVFRETMIRALTSVRADASVLEAALSVFVSEPTMDWLDLARRHAQRKGISFEENKTEYPKRKLETARKKLNGGYPCRLALREIEMAVPASDSREKKEFLNPTARVLCPPDVGDIGSARRGLATKKGALTPAEQVDVLLETASDPAVLRCGFSGWKPLM